MSYHPKKTLLDQWIDAHSETDLNLGIELDQSKMKLMYVKF